MASCDWNEVEAARSDNLVAGWSRRLVSWFAKRRALAAARRRQRLDRQAFLNLLGREEWVYRDMGISKADVEWSSHLPLHVNAARELEALRAKHHIGR